jgi:hypothetical protein
MNQELTKWAAAAVLSVGAAAPALGGSVTRPGDTIGLAVGVPLPEGLWLANNTTQECRNTVDTPILVWSSPWTIFGARLQPAFGPVVPIKFNSGANGTSGLFNSFAAAQLIWDLGNNWGFSYMPAVAPDLPAYCRWRPSEALGDLSDRPAHCNATGNLFAFLKLSAAKALRRGANGRLWRTPAKTGFSSARRRQTLAIDLNQSQRFSLHGTLLIATAGSI